MTLFVVPHDPEWPQDFESETLIIDEALGEAAIVLHHIGSTAISGILAKPIIDMLGVVQDIDAFGHKSAVLRGIGYEAMGAYGIEGRLYFRKLDAAGCRTHHLHVYETGSRHIERHLAFRDYLRSNPRKAAEYSGLKARITSGSEVSWQEYMDAKDPFITETERHAVDWYRKRNLESGDR
ncbi:MAG TPA: GrpB family protein [Tabrizicola sp.]|jgi:GrpB-like predicted nucleotidyltransferase (UPF0157 family)|nr:GrpB family protein [Tabrizicola sp.]